LGLISTQALIDPVEIFVHIGLVIYGSLQTRSGGYLYDQKLVEYLNQKGDRVTIVSIQHQDYLHHLGDNFSTALLNCLRDLPLDILLQDELNHPSLFWLNRRLRKVAAYPMVTIVHHLRSSEPFPAWQKIIYRWVEGKYLTSVDAFIYNSEATQQAVQRLVHMNRPRLIAYPAGDRFDPHITDDQIRIRAHAAGPLRLVFLGNIIPRKNLHVLLKALSKLDPDSWHLVVIGNPDIDPAYTFSVSRQIEEDGIAQQVQFLGSISDQRLAGVLESSHVLAIPSSYEGYGIAYLEGMGFGLPALGSAAGGAQEIIQHGKNGFLIQPGDSESLTTCLLQLTQNRVLLTEMGIAAKNRYLAHPNWATTANRVREFLYTL
jgi:glycosyltransferase involved in cell wall biosynthesis